RLCSPVRGFPRLAAHTTRFASILLTSRADENPGRREVRGRDRLCRHVGPASKGERAMERVDPAIAEVLAAFPIDLGQLSAETLPVVRELIGATQAVELSDDVERTDHTVPASGDQPEVTLRVH